MSRKNNLQCDAIRYYNLIKPIDGLQDLTSLVRKYYFQEVNNNGLQDWVVGSISGWHTADEMSLIKNIYTSYVLSTKKFKHLNHWWLVKYAKNYPS